MSDKQPTISVRNLSKTYTISHSAKPSYYSLKDSLSNLLKKPFARKKEEMSETFYALKDVSFDVQKGEIFGVLGANGSGKSTLLKILSRIIEPTEGTVRLHGRVASLLEIGTGFHPELTGRENIYFNGSMLGMNKREINARFDEIVEFSEVGRFIDTPVKFYSSGMYVRLAFSVAAHLNPDILILDEVLAVGDASFQQKSLKKILETMHDGKTVLFVSHSMDSVRQLCKNGILLRHGEVEAIGKVSKIIDHYLLEVMNNDKVDSELHPTWQNDGSFTNEYFDVHTVSIVDEDGKQQSATIDRNRDYWVRIEGEQKTADERFILGYALWDDKSETLVYSSLSTDAEKKAWPKPRTGLVTYLGHIPGHLFNHHTYRLCVVMALYGRYWIHDPESSPIRIGLKVEGEFSKSPYWHDPRAGVIAPNTKNWISN